MDRAGSLIPRLKLGLIGDNIAQSRAPQLHRLAGTQHAIEVTYDLLVPAQRNQDFDGVFNACRREGYRGINVTYPYKELAASRVKITDERVAAMGAINTVLFNDGGPIGFNTDYSGFIRAFRNSGAARQPGTCCIIGAGGVGRALAFALVTLQAREIRLFDRDSNRAQALAADLRTLAHTGAITTHSSSAQAVEGADGVMNATPVGMVGMEGMPLDKALISGFHWAFDAVYTPVDTAFLRACKQSGAHVITGYELFFFQGVDAWAHFSSKSVNEATLRADLAETGHATQANF